MLTAGQVTSIVKECIRDGRELPWVEFKLNFRDSERVGMYVSALANSAALARQPRGLLVWGIEDANKSIVGTNFDPDSTKGAGNEDLRPWLRRLLVPTSVEFDFTEIEVEERRLVALTVSAARDQPVQFRGVEYMRDGSHTKKLADLPRHAARLWRTLDTTPFEVRPAIEDLRAMQVRELLSFETYSELTRVPLVADDEMLRYLSADRVVLEAAPGSWSITNLGALCFARRLDDFDTIRRKAVRFVAYADSTRESAVDATDGTKGYAVGFTGLIRHIERQVPKREVSDPIRRMIQHFPAVSIRELIVNALIHQDLSITGAGPLIEMFKDRLEVSNPGAPLLADTRRLLDSPPQSRNEELATLMRKCGLCEERGSGIDRAALAAEIAQLPAPDFRTTDNHTIATLLGPRTLNEMDPTERLWTTYLHASLKQVAQQEVTNATVRQRFGIEEHNSARASRLLAEAVDKGWIKLFDPSAGKKKARYVPFWAPSVIDASPSE